jgi:MFS family permease
LTSRLGVLREREFRLLFFSRTVSTLGSAMAPVALAFAILDTLHGSPSAIGIVLAARQVPMVALLLIGGVWGDRLPRNRVMVWSNLISFASQGLVAALLLSGTAHLWELALLASVNGAAMAFFFPASSAVIPQTVPEPFLQQANAALRLGLNSANIAGAAIGGLIVAASNPGIGIAVDAASFALAAAGLLAMRLPAGVRIPASSVLGELREGWSDFWSRDWLWSIVIQFGIVNAFFAGSVQVLGPSVAKHHLHGSGGWGLILSAQTLGLVLSGIALLRWRPRRLLRTANFGAFGLALLPLALARPLPLAGVVATAFTAGLCIEVFGVLWQTTMQQEIPGEKLARLSSYDAVGSFALMPLGYVIIGPLADAIGTRATFLATAAIIIIATALVFLSRDVRTLERRTYTARSAAELDPIAN